MTKKINVDQLAGEIFPELIKTYEEQLSAGLKRVEESNSPGALINEISTALRQHSERFTTELLQKVIDELSQDND